MNDIYLVRHGQTAWNKEEIFRGRTDVPLNETGLREAALAAEYFGGKQVHAIYSSPLRRAWQTAERIASATGAGIAPLEGINDMCFGNWEGQPLNDVRANDAERFRQWQEAPHLVRIPGGESLDEVGARAMAVLKETICSHPGQTVILVSHRVVNKVLICGVLGIDHSHFWQIGQDTTAINLVQCRSGKFVLALLNESCHLKAIRGEKQAKDF